VTVPEEDQWAAWFSRRRHGGDPEQLRRTLEYLAPIRDRVVRNAGLSVGDTVLDVGCGDGLIAFAAAQVVGPSGLVIFSDVSADLLARCHELAAELELTDRCRFVQAPASELGEVAGMSVDAVTVRSVLIYEPAKADSFAEFFRVLRPGGRLSIFEPINRFAASPDGRFVGCNVDGVTDLAAKVRAVYEAIQPRDTDPMLDFDERDLLRQAEQAGFDDIHLRLDADIRKHVSASWEAALRSAGNPRIPTLGEAMHQALSPDEVARLSARLRPQFEGGTRQDRMAVAYVTAKKPDQSRVNGS
jgi:arsenite methyltransferase